MHCICVSAGLQCKASGDRLTLIIATNNESFTAALDLLSSSTRFSELVLVCDVSILLVLCDFVLIDTHRSKSNLTGARTVFA